MLYVPLELSALKVFPLKDIVLLYFRFCFFPLNSFKRIAQIMFHGIILFFFFSFEGIM